MKKSLSLFVLLLTLIVFYACNTSEKTEDKKVVKTIESPRDFGTLGDVNEPLLALALLDIQGLGRFISNTPTAFRPIKTNVNIKPIEESMYIENDLFLNRLDLE